MDDEHVPSPEPFAFNLLTERVIGNGSFGVVFEARIVETGEVVAIKKVLQDRRFKNRELQVIKGLKHPNIVALKHYFYQAGEKEEEIYLNLVLEYVPETVHRITRTFVKLRQLPPLLCVKLYMYQLCRSLAYLHATGICHRDIKPQNLLVDPRTHILKLCDFGSAKALIPGEPSVAYICSRYYRAPELIFGATDYTTAIDIWSAGCVAGELLLGHPLFPGNTGVDQLVEIIKTLGTPRPDEVIAMNPAYTDFKFPQVKPYPWDRFFRPARAPPEALALISDMLQYVPAKRLTAIEAVAHPFFDELRNPATRLPPPGGPMPPLFDFTPEELRGVSAELRAKLIPPHARNAENWPSPLPPAPPTAAAAAAAAAPATSAVAPPPSLPPRTSSGSLSASARGLDRAGSFPSSGVSAPPATLVPRPPPPRSGSISAAPPPPPPPPLAAAAIASPAGGGIGSRGGSAGGAGVALDYRGGAQPSDTGRPRAPQAPQVLALAGK